MKEGGDLETLGAGPGTDPPTAFQGNLPGPAKPLTSELRENKLLLAQVNLSVVIYYDYPRNKYNSVLLNRTISPSLKKNRLPVSLLNEAATYRNEL